ncbi:MAG: hypothetical protein K6G51_00360 [Sphaerochaetaceae bacterium]|nr:hypothetical protein [Sphaerochaetaceae bacterium]
MEVKKRPGRKLAAEKRRIARETMKSFIGSPEFYALDRKVQVAILQLCPSVKEPKREEENIEEIDISPFITYRRFANAF